MASLSGILSLSSSTQWETDGMTSFGDTSDSHAISSFSSMSQSHFETEVSAFASTDETVDENEPTSNGESWDFVPESLRLFISEAKVTLENTQDSIREQVYSRTQSPTVPFDEFDEDDDETMDIHEEKVAVVMEEDEEDRRFKQALLKKFLRENPVMFSPPQNMPLSPPWTPAASEIKTATPEESNTVTERDSGTFEEARAPSTDLSRSSSDDIRDDVSQDSEYRARLEAATELARKHIDTLIARKMRNILEQDPEQDKDSFERTKNKSLNVVMPLNHNATSQEEAPVDNSPKDSKGLVDITSKEKLDVAQEKLDGPATTPALRAAPQTDEPREAMNIEEDKHAGSERASEIESQEMQDKNEVNEPSEKHVCDEKRNVGISHQTDKEDLKVDAVEQGIPTVLLDKLPRVHPVQFLPSQIEVYASPSSLTPASSYVTLTSVAANKDHTVERRDVPRDIAAESPVEVTLHDTQAYQRQFQEIGRKLLFALQESSLVVRRESQASRNSEETETPTLVRGVDVTNEPSESLCKGQETTIAERENKCCPGEMPNEEQDYKSTSEKEFDAAQERLAKAEARKHADEILRKKQKEEEAIRTAKAAAVAQAKINEQDDMKRLAAAALAEANRIMENQFSPLKAFMNDASTNLVKIQHDQTEEKTQTEANGEEQQVTGETLLSQEVAEKKEKRQEDNEVRPAPATEAKLREQYGMRDLAVAILSEANCFTEERPREEPGNSRTSVVEVHQAQPVQEDLDVCKKQYCPEKEEERTVSTAETQAVTEESLPEGKRRRRKQETTSAFICEIKHLTEEPSLYWQENSNGCVVENPVDFYHAETNVVVSEKRFAPDNATANEDGELAESIMKNAVDSKKSDTSGTEEKETESTAQDSVGIKLSEKEEMKCLAAAIVAEAKRFTAGHASYKLDADRVSSIKPKEDSEVNTSMIVADTLGYWNDEEQIESSAEPAFIKELDNFKLDEDMSEAPETSENGKQGTCITIAEAKVREQEGRKLLAAVVVTEAKGHSSNNINEGVTLVQAQQDRAEKIRKEDGIADKNVIVPGTWENVDADDEQVECTLLPLDKAKVFEQKETKLLAAALLAEATCLTAVQPPNNLDNEDIAMAEITPNCVEDNIRDIYSFEKKTCVAETKKTIYTTKEWTDNNRSTTFVEAIEPAEKENMEVAQKLEKPHDDVVEDASEPKPKHCVEKPHASCEQDETKQLAAALLAEATCLAAVQSSNKLDNEDINMTRITPNCEEDNVVELYRSEEKVIVAGTQKTLDAEEEWTDNDEIFILDEAELADKQQVEVALKHEKFDDVNEENATEPDYCVKKLDASCEEDEMKQRDAALLAEATCLAAVRPSINVENEDLASVQIAPNFAEDNTEEPNRHEDRAIVTETQNTDDDKGSTKNYKSAFLVETELEAARKSTKSNDVDKEESMESDFVEGVGAPYIVKATDHMEGNETTTAQKNENCNLAIAQHTAVEDEDVKEFDSVDEYEADLAIEAILDRNIYPIALKNELADIVDAQRVSAEEDDANESASVEDQAVDDADVNESDSVDELDISPVEGAEDLTERNKSPTAQKDEDANVAVAQPILVEEDCAQHKSVEYEDVKEFDSVDEYEAALAIEAVLDGNIYSIALKNESAGIVDVQCIIAEEGDANKFDSVEDHAVDEADANESDSVNELDISLVEEAEELTGRNDSPTAQKDENANVANVQPSLVEEDYASESVCVEDLEAALAVEDENESSIAREIEAFKDVDTQPICIKQNHTMESYNVEERVVEVEELFASLVVEAKELMKGNESSNTQKDENADVVVAQHISFEEKGNESSSTQKDENADVVVAQHISFEGHANANQSKRVKGLKAALSIEEDRLDMNESSISRKNEKADGDYLQHISIPEKDMKNSDSVEEIVVVSEAKSNLDCGEELAEDRSTSLIDRELDQKEKMEKLAAALVLEAKDLLVKTGSPFARKNEKACFLSVQKEDVKKPRSAEESVGPTETEEVILVQPKKGESTFNTIEVSTEEAFVIQSRGCPQEEENTVIAIQDSAVSQATRNLKEEVQLLEECCVTGEICLVDEHSVCCSDDLQKPAALHHTAKEEEEHSVSFSDVVQKEPAALLHSAEEERLMMRVVKGTPASEAKVSWQEDMKTLAAAVVAEANGHVDGYSDIRNKEIAAPEQTYQVIKDERATSNIDAAVERNLHEQEVLRELAEDLSLESHVQSHRGQMHSHEAKEAALEITEVQVGTSEHHVSDTSARQQDNICKQVNPHRGRVMRSLKSILRKPGSKDRDKRTPSQTKRRVTIPVSPPSSPRYSDGMPSPRKPSSPAQRISKAVEEAQARAKERVRLHRLMLLQKQEQENSSNYFHYMASPGASPWASPRASPRDSPKLWFSISPKSSPMSSPRARPRASPMSTPKVSPRARSRASPKAFLKSLSRSPTEAGIRAREFVYQPQRHNRSHHHEKEKTDNGKESQSRDSKNQKGDTKDSMSAWKQLAKKFADLQKRRALLVEKQLRRQQARAQKRSGKSRNRSGCQQGSYSPGLQSPPPPTSPPLLPLRTPPKPVHDGHKPQASKKQVRPRSSPSFLRPTASSMNRQQRPNDTKIATPPGEHSKQFRVRPLSKSPSTKTPPSWRSLKVGSTTFASPFHDDLTPRYSNRTKKSEHSPLFCVDSMNQLYEA